MANDMKNRHTSSVLRRIVLGAMVVIGAFMFVLPLATNLPGKSAATGNLMTSFRPHMTDAALAQTAADQRTMAAMGQQLNTTMLPALATQLHMTPAQLSAYLTANFPSVGAGLAQFSTILSRFGGLQSTMAAQESNFQQADQIPTGFLPPTSMTALFLIPGGLLMVLGAIGLARPRAARAMIALTTAVGVVVVGGLLAVSMSSKTSAADRMTTAFAPVFATQSVQQMRADTNTVEAMATEFSQKTLPAIATALHMTPAQMGTLVTQQFPAVAAGQAQLPQIVERMATATGLVESNVNNYNQSASIPWSSGSMVTMFWLMMVPGLLVVVAGAGALVFGGGRRRVASLPIPRAHAGAMHS